MKDSAAQHFRKAKKEGLRLAFFDELHKSMRACLPARPVIAGAVFCQQELMIFVRCHTGKKKEQSM